MSAATTNYDLLVKAVVVGDSGVGKSSLLKRFNGDPFIGSICSTLGVDFFVHIFKIKGTTVKLQLWDTAGQERFRNVIRSYYHAAQLVLLVFDVTDKESFDHIPDWLHEVETNAEKDTKVILIASKCDLEDKRVISKEIITKTAQLLNLPVIETSAKSAQNVDVAFMTAVETYLIAKSFSPKPTSKPQPLPLELEKGCTLSCCEIM